MKSFVCVILAFTGFSSGLTEDEICPRRHHALLIALLPLHGGFDCREWMQKGVQQRAALEAAIEDVNAENELQIGLKIVDTCSDREKAAEAARKAVAFAEKRCSKFPVFLGFLGPDDEESLRSVLGIIRHPQVAPASTGSFQHSAINIDIINVEERTRRITTFLKYLNWYSFILLFTSDTVSSQIGESLIASEDFCLTNTILRIPSFASGPKNRTIMNKVRKAVEGVEKVRIVILADDPNVLDYFTDYVDEEWGNFEYVVYTRTSGILPWRSPARMSGRTIVLQETPKSPLLLPDFEDTIKNSSLWQSYINQLGNNCEGCNSGKIMLDTTIPPYVYSIHLFSRALRTATRKKCNQALICDQLKSMTPEEWKTTLENTITVVNSQKIRFYMQLETQINIVINATDEVGYISDDLIINRSNVPKRLNRTKSKQCLVDMYEYELEDDVAIPVPTTTTEEVAIAEEERIPINFGYFELMVTVITFPVGLVIFIGLVIFCVCRSLRDKPDKGRQTNLSTDSGVEDYN